MRWVHHLWLELHLQLFATRPEGLYRVLESHTVPCVPVHRLALNTRIMAIGQTYLDMLSMSFRTMS